MRLRPARCAFTLVELLVVIGIIALLIGLLLPVLNRVQSKGRDIACQSNIRQIATALIGYANENKGYFPYGFHWARTNKPMGSALDDWKEAAGNNAQFVSWAGSIGKWLHKGARGEVENDEENYPDVLRCPEAQLVRPHRLSYVMNMTIAVDPYLELKTGAQPPRAQLRPAQLGQMRKDTVLLWDTAVYAMSDVDLDNWVGADIDSRRFFDGAAIPQYRYFNLSDPFASFDPVGSLGQNRPIALDMTISEGKFIYKNIDPSITTERRPYQGNLRFRHQGNTACNAGFADGHVEAFKGTFKSDKTIRVVSGLPQHNALRRYFMIKWPTGVTPDPNVPY